MSNKKKWTIIGLISGVLIAAMVLVFIFLPNRFEADSNKISDMFLRFYEEQNVAKMDKKEVGDKLGMMIEENDDVVAVGNFVIGDDLAEDFSDPLMILFFRDNDRKRLMEKYENLENFLAYIGENEEIYGERNVDLSMKAILRQEEDYLYFLVGDDTELLERELRIGGLNK